MQWRGFIGSSFQSQSVIADAEETINFYVERMQSEGAKNFAALYPTPGFQAWSQPVSTVGGRGSIVAEGRLFMAFGSGFYEFKSDGSFTKWGGVTLDANPVTMAFNGLVGGQICLSSGTNLYVFALGTNTFTPVANMAGKATMVAFATNFFLAFDITTGHVALSALNDGTTWTPAGIFFQRSLFGDPWQSMFVDTNNLVWLIGTQTFEVWYNAGQSPTQPFTVLTGLVGRLGICAPFAFCLADDFIAWVSQNTEGAGSIVMTRGGPPQKISSYAVDLALGNAQRAQKITDAEMFGYQELGHTFIIVALPSVPMTMAYDTGQPSWCKRGLWNPPANRYELWSPRTHVYAFGKHLIGDRNSGTVAWMDSSFATEITGTGIRRLRRAPGLTKEHARMPYDRIELLMDVGVGLPSGQGSDPQAMMRMSYDGGVTFGNLRNAGTGRIGEYRRRVYWNRWGVNPDAVVEFTVSDPIPTRIIDAWINPQDAEAT